jgi:hypothetical protein
MDDKENANPNVGTNARSAQPTPGCEPSLTEQAVLGGNGGQATPASFASSMPASDVYGRHGKPVCKPVRKPVRRDGVYHMR